FARIRRHDLAIERFAELFLRLERLPHRVLACACTRTDRRLDGGTRIPESRLEAVRRRLGGVARLPLILQLARRAPHRLLVFVGRECQRFERRASLLERAPSFALAALVLLPLRVARVEDGIARGTKLLPQRTLVALRERHLLRLLLPLRLYRLHL